MKYVAQNLGMRCSGGSLATAAWRSWKRAGPITPRSLDRNELLLNILQNVFPVFREVRVRIDSDHKISFLINKIRFVSGDSYLSG